MITPDQAEMGQQGGGGWTGNVYPWESCCEQRVMAWATMDAVWVGEISELQWGN